MSRGSIRRKNPSNPHPQKNIGEELAGGSTEEKPEEEVAPFKMIFHQQSDTTASETGPNLELWKWALMMQGAWKQLDLFTQLPVK